MVVSSRLDERDISLFNSMKFYKWNSGKPPNKNTFWLKWLSTNNFYPLKNIRFIYHCYCHDLILDTLFTTENNLATKRRTFIKNYQLENIFFKWICFVKNVEIWTILPGITWTFESDSLKCTSFLTGSSNKFRFSASKAVPNYRFQ